MLTVDFYELDLKPGSVVLDAGCGTGRHLRQLMRIPGVMFIGIDKNGEDLRKSIESLKEIPDSVAENYLISKADINKLPFAAACFDSVICSEVLEHIPEHEIALKELVRVLKPQGDLVVSVPRYFSEKICWLISPAYYNDDGGHIRIYKKKKLQKMLTKQGIKCWKINYKHALHVPYWWLKCLIGLKNEKHWLIKYYKKFLEWDIMKKPQSVRIIEELLNPIMGKSIVFYLKKD
jgi:2-polyprenyl-3-methyl-5-hydroxy-6-metoxy-1,4-benzoquinol methylase